MVSDCRGMVCWSTDSAAGRDGLPCLRSTPATVHPKFSAPHIQNRLHAWQARLSMLVIGPESRAVPPQLLFQGQPAQEPIAFEALAAGRASPSATER